MELKALNEANLLGRVIPLIRCRKQISFQVHKPSLTSLLLLLSHIGAIRNEGIALEGKHIMQVFRPAGNCSLLTCICLMICWSESQKQGQESEGAGGTELCLVWPCLGFLELRNTSHHEESKDLLEVPLAMVLRTPPNLFFSTQTGS